MLQPSSKFKKSAAVQNNKAQFYYFVAGIIVFFILVRHFLPAYILLTAGLGYSQLCNARTGLDVNNHSFHAPQGLLNTVTFNIMVT
jgi:hypothetical protein